jgi:hypothetical protein
MTSTYNTFIPVLSIVIPLLIVVAGVCLAHLGEGPAKQTRVRLERRHPPRFDYTSKRGQ